jgi:hypothetical protein
MTDFARLKQSVDNWLSRDDIAVTGTDIDEITLIAESNITRDVTLATQEVTTTLTFTGREQDLPANYLGPRFPFINDNIRKFEYKTPEALREDASWNDGRAGAFYTLEGSKDATGNDDRVKMVIAGPASVASPLSIEVNYYARLDPLVNDTDTNWLLINHYDIYLYAMLTAAAEYLREDKLLARYESKYEKVVGKQGKHENRKRFGRMPKQSYGNPRGVV